MEKENIHKSHRQRMRDKFDKIGFNGWSDYEIMEYMLYNVYRQGDTNPVAHRLLNYGMGNIVNVLKSSYNFDMANNIDNVGENTVRFLRSLKEFIDYYKRKELEYEPIQLKRDNLPDILSYAEFDYSKEDIVMMCGDKFARITSVTNITELSGFASAETSAEKIVRIASTNNAHYVIMVHNHPDGNLDVSMADIVMTRTVDKLLENIHVHFIDHFITTNRCDYISIKKYIRLYELNEGKSIYDDEMTCI